MGIIFSSKANTLNYLQGKLEKGKICQLVYFSVEEWRVDQKNCLNQIFQKLGLGPYIVRSSSSREDQKEASNAGAFKSILNVAKDNIIESVDEVIKSYGKIRDKDQVLIQQMLKNVIMSGVAFSHDPNTCSPYRIVNWSEGTNTEAVTGGLGGRMWTHAKNSPVKPPKKIKSIIELIDELLVICENTPIDCEFGITSDVSGERLWLLQVRPLVLHSKSENGQDQTLRLKKIHKKVSKGMHSHPFLMGKRTVYGVMPDWNPAEIVGIRPKPLALSLYRELVTDSIWAYQRHNYGYRNLRSFPLMPHFFGLPYIDVRLSFNSFIPADLEESLAGKLVDHYIDRLLQEPSLHDKVEFEIVFSCYTLDLEARLKHLNNFGFSNAEIRTIAQSLRDLTNKILHPTTGLSRSDSKRLSILEERRNKIINSKLDYLDKIYWLIEDTKRYGTLPFAGLARAGFIAVQFLKSLLNVGIFSQNDFDSFMSSITTVSGQMANDRAILSKADFLKQYGHLRPGTYDILSPRYDETPDIYFDWSQPPKKAKKEVNYSLTINQMKKIDKLLNSQKLETDAEGLLAFMRFGIEWREQSKFLFSKNLSDALMFMKKIGEEYNLSPEELSYSDIAAFKEIYVGATDGHNILKKSIELGKNNYLDALKVSLPPLISQPEDIWSFEWPNTVPNFITQKKITARVTKSNDHKLIVGSIVCIENADPGFDWLFSFPIAGLITAWGGANSHMAIRAGELGLPAIIGAGELFYSRWSSANTLHMDCAGKKVEILS